MFRFEPSVQEVFLMKITTTVILILAAFSVNAQQLFNNLEDSAYSKQWIGMQNIDSGFAHSGSHFSVVDSSKPYGLGLESRFPESIQGKNIQLKISGWVKSDVVFDEAIFVLSLKQDDEDLLWKGIKLDTLIKENNHWFYFSDSLIIPGSISAKAIIKAYLWNSDGKNKMGIDDLKFEFIRIQNPSFFPQIIQKKDKARLSDKPIYENSFYKIYYQKKDKSVRFVSRDGNPVIENIWFLSEQIKGKKTKVKQATIRFKKIEIFEKRADLYFKTQEADIVLICHESSPEIQFQVVSNYKRNQDFIRQSLVLKSGQKVEEVLRKNRKSDIDNFQEEYWLDKEGVCFGSGQNSLIIYHNTHISSLQLKPADSLLAINLDYEKDHPFLHFPLDNDTIDLKLDWSSSKYAEASQRQFNFSIFVGTKARNLPRLMKNPNGFLATYIWTEHADWTDIRTNRATYFGSEKITNPDKATGGFVFYKIPITKSVFWANPDGIRNSTISDGKFNSEESTITDDVDFHTFLNEIHLLGHEICLHTPEQFTTTSERLETALKFMQDKFASPSWIDHGYNNKIQNNREDLICDGSLEESGYYSVSLWEKYGVKYFWNAYYEEFFPFADLKFSKLIGKPYSGFGDFYPKPDFWQHPSRTASVYHWPTTSVLFVPENRLWDYYFSDQVLNHFVDDWAVEINHCYPAWVDTKKGFWLWDSDSTIVAAPGFNHTLERMAALRDNGQLNVTTISNFMDYRLAIEQVSYEILPDGSIQITNKSNTAIIGLSFATRSSFLLLDGVPPSQKVVGDDVIFWFDLGAGESKRIRVFE